KGEPGTQCSPSAWESCRRTRACASRIRHKKEPFIEVPPFGRRVKQERAAVPYTKRLCGRGPLRVTSPASSLTCPEHRPGPPLLFLQQGDRAKPQTRALL